MQDPSSAHEKAAVALRFKKARREYLVVFFKIEEYTDTSSDQWFKNGEVQKAYNVRECRAFITYTKSAQATNSEHVGLMLCYGYIENPIAEAYANGTVKKHSTSTGGYPILSWRFAEPHEL